MGSSPGFGGVHVLPFASTWVYPRVLVESMSYPSRAHGFIPGFWWSPCLTLREHMSSSPGFGGVHVLPFASTWVHPRVLVESMSYPSRAHGFIPGFWWSPCPTLREHMGSSPGFGGVHVLPFASTWVHPRVLVESMSYPSRAHGFIPGFWWSPCLTLREHMGSSPDFGGVHVFPFASTCVHPRVLMESMSFPSRAPGFIPGFWWSPCLTLREHMGSSPGFGGVHILPFASTWVHPRVLVESMSYRSRAHGFIPGFWWSPCLTLREHIGSSPGFGGVHVLPFASTWVHPRVLMESMSYPSRVHGSSPGFWWSPCLTLREPQGSSAGFGGVHVAYLFCFLYCVVFLCFVCICPASCMTNVVSVSDRPASCMTNVVSFSDRPASCMTNVVSVSDRPASCMTNVVSVSDRPASCMTNVVSVSDRQASCMTNVVSVSDRPASCMTNVVSVSDRPASCNS